MIRWGFIGAGWIAAKALVPAVLAADNAVLYAVASRDLSRAEALGAEKSYGSYEQLLADPNVDAVYICLANHQHREWTIRALNAGKHVLCEKPLALNYEQAQQMADAAHANNRLLVEAVWSRWHPRFIRAVDAVRSGEIGSVLSIDSAFTFTGELENNYRLLPEMGGGALLDVGTYQVHTWQGLIGASAGLRIDSVDRVIGGGGVDMTTQIKGAVGGTKVTTVASFIQPENQRLIIMGDQGSIEFMGNAAFTSWHQESVLRINGQDEVFSGVDPYRLMVEHFGRSISGENAWVLGMDDSLQVMRVLDAIACFKGGKTE